MAKSQSEIVFGIHVGNTSACLASYKDGKAQVIANDVGDRITPAVVAINDTEKVVGTSAKAGIARNNTCTVIHNKRLLDDNIDAKELEKIGKKIPYKILKEATGIKYVLKHGDKTFIITAEAVAVSIFSKLFEIASSSGKFDGDVKVALCVPLHYPQSSRVTIMRAAEEAGFEVLQVIGEPAATALAYGVGIQNSEEELWCLVYRVGGSSIDVTVLEVRAGMFGVIHSEHLSYLGGDQFTSIMTEYLAEEYRKKCKLDPHESRRSMSKLTNAAETCKHVLSTMGTAHCFIESLCEGVDFSYNITRARFESLISPCINEFIEPIKRAMDKFIVYNKDIQRVMLSGGSVKVPKLQKAVRDMFPQAEVLNGMSPDEVIAIGAAKHASYLSRPIDPECQHLWREIPATSLPLFTRATGICDNVCMIQSVTPVPVKKTKTFKVNNSGNVTFQMLEMDSCDLETANAILLGELTLGEVSAPTEVSMDVSLTSVGSMTAVLTDLKTQKKATLKFDPPPE